MKGKSMSASEAGLWSSLHELNEQVRELTATDLQKARVLELLSTVMAQESVDDVCRAMVESVRECLCIDRVGLLLWDEESQVFRGTYGTAVDGQTTDEHHLVFDIWPNHQWSRMVEGERILRGCPLGEPTALPGEEEILADLVALRYRERLYGIISVDNRITRTNIDDATLEYLTLLSRLLASSIESSRERSELGRSERRLREITSCRGDWVWELNAAGEYVYSDDSSQGVLGIAAAGLRGRPVLDTVADADKERVRQVLEAAEQGDRAPRVVTARHLREDQSDVLLESLFIPVADAQGSLAGFRGAHRDVSVSTLAQAQVRRAQRMDAVGRLAGGVAHDFNNLLTTILGTCGELLSQLHPDDPVATGLRHIAAAGERAEHVTRQLVAFSRRQVLSNQWMHPLALLKGVEPELRRLLGDDVEVTVQVEGPVSAVEADPGRVEQILKELAENAREAMKERPDFHQPELWEQTLPVSTRPKQFRIRIANCRIEESRGGERPAVLPGPYVRISVSDSGIGMPATVQEHVFEPFFTTRKMAGGSGMGLAAAYGTMRQMGGDIQVVSQPGEGSTFHLYLPCHQEAGPAAGSGTEEIGDLRGEERILLVEDEDRIRELMERMLHSYGYRTAGASDPRAAAELLKNDREGFHLLITDMQMPGMSIQEFMQRVEEHAPGLPRIFVSGYSPKALDSSLTANSAFIQKPFGRGELVRKVREMLNRRAGD